MKRIAFLLLDGFALLSTASALEPLRAANLFSRSPRYEIVLLSQRGQQAVSSVGGRFGARDYAQVSPRFDLLFVVAGGAPAEVNDPALFAWLRRIDSRGIALGGISGGAVILAKAGLLDKRRFTVHWHHYPDFAQMPGDWLLERRLFVIDRDRYTCAGGSAPLDMMHALIARDHGTEFAQKISDWFIQTEIRGADAPQRRGAERAYGAVPTAIEAALDLMASHIADPLSQDQIADLVGLSARQLQRQFRAATGRSLMQEYRRMRLQTGRDLVLNSRVPLAEIANMTGFSSQAHFSTAFAAQFGTSPSALRKSAG